LFRAAVSFIRPGEPPAHLGQLWPGRATVPPAAHRRILADRPAAQRRFEPGKPNPGPGVGGAATAAAERAPRLKLQPGTGGCVFGSLEETDSARRIPLRLGDAGTQVLPVVGLLTPDAGTLRRNVGIGGLSFRPNQK